MFSFHKPKVYRSSTGCCICKAKSSSSRFTDSKKYEDDFMECFLLEERRTGEICNACVLLVKRWKKLPAGSNRNWNHVVDARAGPGIKSMTKFKSKKNKKLKILPEKLGKVVKKKHVYLKAADRDREQSPAMSDELNDDEMMGNGSKSSSRSGSPAGSDDIAVDSKILINGAAIVKSHVLGVDVFMELDYFKREEYCCGTIYKGLFGEVITEPKLHKSCSSCPRPQSQPKQQQQPVQQQNTGNSPAHSSASASPVHSSASTSPAHSVESSSEPTVTKPAKTFSEGQDSSDSGYDESSNQGLGESKIAKFLQTTSAKIPVKLQPIKSVHLKMPVSEVKRLQLEVPMKPLDQIVCKPISLVTSANVTLSNSTSHPAATVPANPLVDFAMHASSRQSLSN